MFEIVQKIIDLVTAWINYLLPWVILGDDQVGLVRRLGKFNRLLEHGFNWKIPLIETAMSEVSARDSTVLREQSLTTLDGVQVTVKGVICYRVINARTYILGCANAVSVLNDVGCCAVSEVVPTLPASVVLRGIGVDGEPTDVFETQLLNKVRERAKKWGVKIESIGLVDRTEAPAFRVLTGGRVDPDSLSTNSAA